MYQLSPEPKHISIHALLAESDNDAINGCNPDIHFYPRSPCGERRIHYDNYNLHCVISIHALLAESDHYNLNLPSRPIERFLSTLSLRRATQVPGYTELLAAYFYPRSPCGERPLTDDVSVGGMIISIHALLAESDCPLFFSCWLLAYFYPRSPCGERRRGAVPVILII